MADRVVIMSRGLIEQIGTPQEIYGTPRTRFVADFLGSSNIFSGKVRSADARGIEIETPDGRIALSATNLSTPPRVGDTATLTVLDTKTHLSVAPPDGVANVVPVRVIGEEFVGATATLYLETANGHEIRVQKGHDELAALPLDIGQQLFAHWSPSDSHLVAEA